MIKSFKNKMTEKAAAGHIAKGFPKNILRQAQQRIIMLDSATDLNDLRIPPSNRLEALSGKRKGQYSIRINAQWRLCFEWINGQAENVEIVDYH